MGKMKASILDGVRSIARVEQVDIPEIGPDDALIKVVASGICRSDWHLWNGDWAWFDQKLFATLGHEIGGVVEAVGSNVKNIKTGMRVTTPIAARAGKISVTTSRFHIHCRGRVAGPNICVLQMPT
jgi:propanol-preferring alcohol dehydrogenase